MKIKENFYPASNAMDMVPGWMNFQPPAVPAELTFLGIDYRERERIKRKKARWAAKFSKLPAAERAAIMEALLELAPA